MNTFLNRMERHIGGLIEIKTELYWYGARAWDKSPGRICLLLEATTGYTIESSRFAAHTANTSESIAALLLIDGSPRWVWMAKEDVETLNETA